jgi:hypothetical protein
MLKQRTPSPEFIAYAKELSDTRANFFPGSSEITGLTKVSEHESTFTFTERRGTVPISIKNKRRPFVSVDHTLVDEDRFK